MRFQRTGYDFEAAAARIRRSGHPSAEEFAVHNVLRPPTEEQAIEVFEAVALGSGVAER